MPTLRPTRALGALALLIVAHVAASLYWIQVNITPYGRDAGGHLTRALQHAEILRELTWQTLFQAVTFHGFRPPALYLAAQIPYRLFGWEMDSALYTNVFFLAVILVFTYLIAKRMMGNGTSWFPLLAVAVVGFLPMLAAMARTFYLDGFLTAALLVILYALLQSDNFTHKGWTVVWGIAIGVGMLVKWSLPAHVVLPFLYYGWRANLLQSQIAALRRPHIHWKVATLSVAVAAALSTLWYFPNRDHALTLPLGDGLWLFWFVWLIPTAYFLLLPRSTPTPLSTIERGIEGVRSIAVNSRRHHALLNFWAGVFLAVAVASIWYVARIDFLTELSDTAFGDYDGRFDTENTEYNVLTFRNLTRYPEYVVTRQLGWLCGLLILPIVGWVWLRRARGWKTARLESWILWLSILSTYLLLLLTPRETSARNLVPLLPIFAILFVDAVRDLPRRWQPAVAGVWLVALAVHWSVYTFDALDGFWNQSKIAWAQSEFLLRPNSGPTAAGFWIGPDVLATVAASHNPDIQPKTILGMLINSPEIHRGPYNYLIRTDYPDTLDLVELTERFPDMWIRTIRSEWVLTKNGDNHDLDEPGLRVVDEVYSHPNGLFPLLFQPQKEYPLPNGEMAILWRRIVGQPYLPEPKEELKSLAESLTKWLHEDTPLLLSEAAQGVELGLLDLTPHHVQVMGEGLPDSDTLFVLLHRGEPSDAAVWAQLQEGYVLAWDGWFGSEYLTIWGRTTDTPTLSTPALRFGESVLAEVEGIDTVTAGGVIPITTRWQVGTTPLKASYRLLNSNGEVIAQLDRDVTPDSRLGLFVPPDTPAGRYTIAVTVYDPATIAPVLLESGESVAPLFEVEIEAGSEN
jgi:4-amino-4-deoxy-L-arabinose transferase-like glycosyltransferase